MKKSLLALAALTCIAGAAQAQSSVTLSGTIDNWVGQVNNQTNNFAKQTVLGSGGIVGKRLKLTHLE